jgi:iron complex outermembrane receptor protein
MAVPVQAQDGVLAGMVTDSLTGDPIAGVEIEIVRGFGSTVGSAVSGADGSYRLRVPAGRYSVVVSSFGYVTRRFDEIEIAAETTSPLAVVLQPQALALNPLVISASRSLEKTLDAPAVVYLVQEEEIGERVAPTPFDHVRNLPGVDASQASLQQSYVVTRGFNNVFTGSLLVLTDGRYAQLPSARLNANYMIPANDLDVERIEMTLGPGSALYGPNATDGVMHIVTKPPIDYPGTSVSVAGGERSLFHGMFRSAVAGEKVGFKVSGEYFRGNDWESLDSVEEAAREADPDNPLIGARDFTAARWSAEARFDARPDERTEVVVTAGHNMTDRQLELTGVGRGQQIDYRFSFVQGRFQRDRFSVDLFGNFTHSGDSRLLRTGEVALDMSRLFAGRLQHGIVLGSRLSLLYGLDVQRTEARTNGTINGRFEDDDTVDELGLYVHSETELTDQLELVAAARVDFHNRLSDPVFSPRVALSFTPGEGHRLRASFNRAFITPTGINLFLDLRAALIPIIPGFITYDVRAVGVPESGYTFGECAGGFNNLCMRSPIVPGVSPADATLAWDALVGAIAPDLATLLPNPGNLVGTVLRRLDLGAEPGESPFPLDPEGPTDITGLVPTISNTFEIGYKGLLGGRLFVTPSVYFTHLEDFVRQLAPETPQVFYDPATTAAYVNQRLGPLVEAGIIGQGDIDALVAGLAAIPVGTVSPEEWDSPAVLLTARNYGTFNLWGWDISAELLATSQLSLTGTMSYASEECLDFDEDGSCFSTTDVALNAPQFKGGLSARYEWPTAGVFAEARARFVGSFPMNSGVYVGTVDAYTVFDIAAGAPLPWFPGASVQISASNVFDNRHREFVGAPELGRFILARLRYDF